MGKILDNRQLVESPPVGPLRYGLFAAASSILPMNTRVIASGLTFLADHCGDAAIHDQTCVVSPVKPFTEGSEFMDADPFWIVARKRCGAVGRSGQEMLTAVRQQLSAREQGIVEAQLWDGATEPSLVTSGATIVTPAAPGAGAAIAALEEAFYDMYGFVGTIHVNTAAYGAASYSNLVEHDTGRLKTPLKSVWSFGSGYDTTGPGGIAPAPGFVWAFMTGATTLWRTDILPQPNPRQTLDRELNQWDVVAERVYAASWDCPMVAAVQIPVAAPATTTAPAVPPADVPGDVAELVTEEV